MQALDRSQVRFVYPVIFDAETFPARTAAVEARRWEGLDRLWIADDRAPDEAIRAVRDYFVPTAGRGALARHWKLDGNALQSLKGLGAATSAEWYLEAAGRRMRFCLERVELSLFHLGVGLVSVELKPAARELDTWLDLLHFGRCLCRDDIRLEIRRRTGLDPQTGQAQWSDWSPDPERLGTSRPGAFGLGPLIATLLATARLQGGAADWYREVFVPGYMLPVASLFLRDVPQEEQSRALYRIENFFHAAQPIHLSAAVERLAERQRLPYADRQWFLFSLEGGAFVAFDPPEGTFFQETLPGILQQQYFFLFQLVLYQRAVLTMLSNEVAERWLSSQQPLTIQEALFAHLRRQILDYSARVHFNQVMPRHNHHRYYRRWQKEFQIESLYSEVRREIDDIHEHVAAQRSALVQDGLHRLDLRLRQVAFLLGPPALLLSYLGTTGWAGPITSAVVIAAGLSLGWCGWKLLHRGVSWQGQVRMKDER